MINGDELEEPSASNVMAGRRDRSYEVSRNYPSDIVRTQKQKKTKYSLNEKKMMMMIRLSFHRKR